MITLKELRFRTGNGTSFIEITGNITDAVKETGLQEGSVVVYVPHTTCAITINENADPDVIRDLQGIVDKLVPRQDPYRHREGNTAAHMWSSMLGASETLILHRGKLLLGTWQGIYLADFDGPRERRVLVQVQGE